MDFAPSERSIELTRALRAFIDDSTVPARPAYDEALATAPAAQPAVMNELRHAARAVGLWNLCVRDPDHGPGLSFVEYAPLAASPRCGRRHTIEPSPRSLPREIIT